MPLELVLNELSLTAHATNPVEARQRMIEFLETIRQATKRKAARTLRTDRDLNDVLLAPEYPVRRWLNDAAVEREWRQFFRSLASRSPYLDGLPQVQDRAYVMQCRHSGVDAQGLLAAHLIHGLAVSLRSAAIWHEPEIVVELEQFVGDEIEQSEEMIRHASSLDHITAHDAWIADRTRLPDPRDGAELWAQRTERFPSLHFCDAIEKQLGKYGAGMEEITQIMKRLAELERYAASWTSGRFNAAELPGKVTPESPETLRQYAAERTFLCPDGVERVFSWHARFTPGAGRLYFFPDESGHIIVVGYIGGHLSTVLY